MKTKDKLILEEAIDQALEDIGNNNGHNNLVIEGLTESMARACESVYDMSMLTSDFWNNSIVVEAAK